MPNIVMYHNIGHGADDCLQITLRKKGKVNTEFEDPLSRQRNMPSPISNANAVTNKKG